MRQALIKSNERSIYVVEMEEKAFETLFKFGPVVP